MATGRRTYHSVAATEAPPPAPPDEVTLLYLQLLRYVVAGASVALAGLVIVWIVGTGTMFAIAAGIVWSALLAGVECSRDVLQTEWQLWQARQTARRIAQLEADLLAVEHQRDVALQRAAEHKRHAEPTFVPPDPPPDNPAMRDARHLVYLRYQREEPVSKEYMAQTRNWSADRYLAATAILREHGYYSRNNQWRTYASAAEAAAAFSGR